jgi:hypothetical protein
MTGNRNLSAWMKPVEGKPNTFTTINVGRPRDAIKNNIFEFRKKEDAPEIF